MMLREKEIEYDVNEVIGNTRLLVRFTGKNKFKARVKLATWLFNIGAWILGTKVDIEIELTENGEET